MRMAPESESTGHLHPHRVVLGSTTVNVFALLGHSGRLCSYMNE